MTRRAASAVASTVVLAVTGRVLGIVELIALGVAIFAVVAMAMVTVWARPQPRLAAERLLLPPSVHAGEALDVELVLVNHGGRTPVLRCEEQVDAGGGRTRRRVTLGLAPLDRGSHAVARYRVTTEARGLLPIGPLRVVMSDAAGFAQRRVARLPSTEAVVYPPVVACALPPSAAGAGGALPFPELEWLSLRPYVPGDDVRLVNWRASARTLETTGELLVREDDGPGVRRRPVSVRLITDPAAFAKDTGDSEFERAVEVAASLLLAAGRAGRPVELQVGTAAPMPAGDPAGMAAALHVLATIDVNGEGGPANAFPSAFEGPERFVVAGSAFGGSLPGTTLLRIDPAVTEPVFDGAEIRVAEAADLLGLSNVRRPNQVTVWR